MFADIQRTGKSFCTVVRSADDPDLPLPDEQRIGIESFFYRRLRVVEVGLIRKDFVYEKDWNKKYYKAGKADIRGGRN